MLQRIQSLYLLLAVVCAGMAVGFAYESVSQKDWTHFTYMSIMLLEALLLVYVSVRYTHRPQQMKLIHRGTLLNFIAICLSAWWLISTDSAAPLQVLYILLPTIVLFFSHFAFRAIRSDEQKVRAADRIR